MTTPVRASLIAAAVTGVAILGACSEAPAPPPLSERDLQNVVSMDAIGKEMPDAAQALAATPGFCVDLHHGEPSFFAGTHRGLSHLDQVLIRLGLSGGVTGWRGAGLIDPKPVDPATVRRLARVTARLTLKFAREEAPAEPDKPWPERCRQRYWLTTPVYQDDFAFVESGADCGGLCGGGRLIALEYRNGRWRVVGVHDTWMA
jgi:hypothetical protein